MTTNGNSIIVKSMVPVINEVDICVLGGSCTGVFAAVRAARLGARVAIVEKQNAFGGMATNGLMPTWHSLYDTESRRQIIAGLTEEMIGRLDSRKALHRLENGHHVTLNPFELMIELDELVVGAGVTPYLHTLFSEPYLDDNANLVGVIVDNKSGRGLIKAKYFVDASGDGDLCHRLGFDSYTWEVLEPPSAWAHFQDWEEAVFDPSSPKTVSRYRGAAVLLTKERAKSQELPFIWKTTLPLKNTLVCASRVSGVNCANADELTQAEIRSRANVRAIHDLARSEGNDSPVSLAALPSTVGIRETRHIRCQYQVSPDDALYGVRFEDAIANGSYKLDEYLQEEITVRYLDGHVDLVRAGEPVVVERWREETPESPTFYQVPLRSIVPLKSSNVMIAGRMVDASSIAFGGIRVIVNLNQLGEAAGVSAALALQKNVSVQDLNPADVRASLANGGSIVI